MINARVSGASVTISLLSFVFIACVNEEQLVSTPNNIILISVDTLRADLKAGEFSKKNHTPHLHALAKKSLVFDSAYSTSGWTLPAHASVMTGLYPDRHNAISPNYAIAAQVPTLAEKLTQAGYHAASFTEGGFLNPIFGFSRGFAQYDHESDGTSSVENAAVPYPLGSKMFSRGKRFLRQQESHHTKPFFLFLQSYGVHDYFALHPWATNDVALNVDPARAWLQCVQGVTPCDEEMWKTLRALYDAEVRYMDRKLGELLNVLQQSKFAHNTVVIFFSDHGEGFDAVRNRIHHGGRLHRDLLHVPLLISKPNTRPRRFSNTVSLVDIFPTVLQIADSEIPDGIDGKSLLKPLNPKRAVFAMEHFHSWQNGARTSSTPTNRRPTATALINAQDYWLMDNNKTVHYDSRKDIRQEHPLPYSAQQAASASKTIERRRANWQQAPLPQNIVPLNKKSVTEELRALGYME